ncbi:MAG: hypothetical protein ACRDV2_04495, partial [Actinomycetes bacterium]
FWRAKRFRAYDGGFFLTAIARKCLLPWRLPQKNRRCLRATISFTAFSFVTASPQLVPLT